ncbi:MAG: NADase-type glycan-binding domain-containing protein [Bacillota bacterium]
MKAIALIMLISFFCFLQLFLFGCEVQTLLPEKHVKQVDQTAPGLGSSISEQQSQKVETSDIITVQPEIQPLDNWMFDGEEFNAGCSWYCAGNVQSVTSSSELKNNNKASYSATMAHDWDLSTAWVEGNPEYGIGEYLDYVIEGSEFDLTINEIILINGYTKTDILWKQNSRVKGIKLYVNGKEYAVLDVKDTKEVQVFPINDILLKGVESVNIRFEITEVYKGDKYKDTAITELEFEGAGHH